MGSVYGVECSAECGAEYSVKWIGMQSVGFECEVECGIVACRVEYGSGVSSVK